MFYESCSEIPPILSCWPVILQVDGGGMAAEAEPSHKYPITFCCYVAAGSRGALWQNDIWHGNVYKTKVCHWILPCRKKLHCDCAEKVFCSWECSLLNTVVVLIVAYLVSMKINRQCYFWRKLLNVAQDNSLSLSMTQASQMVGHPYFYVLS